MNNFRKIEYIKINFNGQSNERPYNPVEFALIDKVNELVEEINKLKQQLNEG